MSRFSRFSKPAAAATSSSSNTIPERLEATARPKDYFDEDEEDEDLGHFKPSKTQPINIQSIGNDDEDDPLDAFMQNIHQQVKKESEITQTQPIKSLPQIVSYGDDEAGIAEDEGDDLEDTEANTRYINSDDDHSDNAEGLNNNKSLNESMKNPKGKLIEPLPRVDHSQITYPKFKKNFNKESSDLRSLSAEEVQAYRKLLEISVTPSSSQIECPKPVKSFLQCGFPQLLLKEIERQGYEKPTAIQAQSLPVALSGYDLLGLAKTGSGKTLAYVWPMLLHILDQPQMQIGEGPIALILVPTRELANQIYVEVRKYAKLFQIRFAVIYGGAGKYEMSKALKESPEIVIATPGRFIEMIKMKATSLTRVTYVVLDEADRMFEMGFEYQIRSILLNIQPSKQLLMFSATMKKRIESFAREMFTNHNEIRVVIGMIGQANADIKQLTHIVPDVIEKWLWLASEIDEFAANGKVLIFVLSKTDTEELALKLKDFFQKRQLDINVDCLHGDKDQSERTKIMSRFVKKAGASSQLPSSSSSSYSSAVATNASSRGNDEITILVATDIASRGLDVKDIRTVINYDVAKNIETYVHRIGRTGRMGIEGVTPGTAHTLLTPKDSSFAVDLVQNLRLSAQEVSDELVQLAMKDPKWHKIRHFTQQGLGGGGGGVGRSSSGKWSSNNNRSGGVSTSAQSFVMGRAMTSEMMANSSQERMNISLPQGIAQAFQAKMENSQKNSGGSEVEEIRKSRFSAAPVPSLPPTPSVSTSVVPATSTTLPGFVRSTTGYSSVVNIEANSSGSSNNSAPLIQGFVKASSTYSSISSSIPLGTHLTAEGNSKPEEQIRKKSRWG